MSISKATSEVNISHIDVRDFADKNKAQNKISTLENKFQRATGKALDNAHRLQKIKREDHGPNVADVYQMKKLEKLINIELYLVFICIIITAASVIGAVFIPLLLIITIYSGWLTTIAYRFYRHHVKCYHYLLELSAQKCPYCHESLLIHT